MNSYYSKQTIHVLLLYVQFIYSSPMKNKNGNFDVDYFLKKVILSKKFDDIAEKIADKAVEKFQQFRDLNKTKTKLHGGETVYRVSNTKPKSDSDEENNKNPDQLSKENDDSDAVTIKTGNVQIDSEAFQRKKAELIKEVSLKYNKFTKGIVALQPSDNEDIKSSATEVSTHPTPSLKETSSEEEAKVKKPLDSNESDGVSANKESVTKRETSVTTETINVATDVTTKSDIESDSSKDSEKQHEVTIGKISKENADSLNGETKELAANDSEDESNSSLNEDNNKQEAKDETTNKPNISHPAIEYLHLPNIKKANEIGERKIRKTNFGNKQKPVAKVASNAKRTFKGDKNIGESDFYKRSDTKLEYKGESDFHKRSDTKFPRIRKEGNKLYTHIEDTDYEDYNEEIARAQRQERDDVAKINYD